MTDQPTRSRRYDLPKLVVTAVVGALVVALVGGLGKWLSDLFDPPDPPRHPVRVLLAIDISGSQTNELRAGSPRTRIQAIQDWAPLGLKSLDERDQLGIATFSTSGRCPRPRPGDRPRTLRRLRRCLKPRLVVPIQSVTPGHKRALLAGLEGLRANAGGTPLHQTIAWGVEQMDDGPDGTNQALVVLTDGDEHASDNLDEQDLVTDDAEARLEEADEPSIHVRVFGTAVSPDADCDLRRPRFYDECYPAVTEPDLRNALTGILGELGLPTPSPQSGAR